ncbi:MAG: ribonuclease P protein component [Nitrospirota bacterium]
MPENLLRSLVKKRDFEQVFREGLTAASKYLVIYAKPNELNFSRLGLSVSKKIGKAVKRNRIKRLLREAMRRLLKEWPFTYDFVLVARKSSVDANMEDFVCDINKFMVRIKDEKSSDISDKTL